MNLADYDFSYLIPPVEVFDVHHEEYYIRHGEDSKSVRKIFDCVPYTDFEKQKLKEFEDMIKKENIQLPPGWRTAYTMKFVYSAKFALDKCLENLKQYLVWLAHPNRSKIPAKSLELLKEGLVYLAGRDKQYRPVIVVNVDRIDLKKMTIEDFTEALCALCFVLEKYCFVPGKVENWILIIETNNASIWNFPYKILQNLVSVTSISFTSTLEKLYLMNPSLLLKGSWNLIQKLLHPETAAKISMLDKSQYNQLQEKIAIDQIEEKYGGTLPKPDVYWPPRDTLRKTPYRKPNEDPARDPRKPIESDSPEKLAKKKASIDSNVPRGIGAHAERMHSSVYYDFETLYVDLPNGETHKLYENRELDKFSGAPKWHDADSDTQTPGQPRNHQIKLEGSAKRSNCCGMRENNSDGCTLF